MVTVRLGELAKVTEDGWLLHTLASTSGSFAVHHVRHPSFWAKPDYSSGTLFSKVVLLVVKKRGSLTFHLNTQKSLGLA